MLYALYHFSILIHFNRTLIQATATTTTAENVAFVTPDYFIKFMCQLPEARDEDPTRNNANPNSNLAYKATKVLAKSEA